MLVISESRFTLTEARISQIRTIFHRANNRITTSLSSILILARKDLAVELNITRLNAMAAAAAVVR